MDKKAFIDTVRRAQKKSSPLPQFTAKDVVSTTAISGTPMEAFKRNFKANHGEVFEDGLGEFTAVRNALLPCYPEDVRLKKLAARAATMAQSGQYNYHRLMRRGDVFGARLALAEFLNAALSMLYMLNFRYEPFYKWQFAGAEGLVAMSEALPYLKDIAASSTRRDADAIARDIEAASAVAISELRLQGLTDAEGDYLEPHAYSIMSKIEDPEIRGLHVMEG